MIDPDNSSCPLAVLRIQRWHRPSGVIATFRRGALAKNSLMRAVSFGGVSLALPMSENHQVFPGRLWAILTLT